MMPRTLLARTFLLLALLVLLTTAAWLSLFRYTDAEPRAREIAQLSASAVNLIRASLFAAAPEKRPGLFAEFVTREGIRLLPAEPEDRIDLMPETRFVALLRRELAARLGEHTRIAAAVDGVPGFWVSFRLDDHDEDEYWLVLPRERAARDFASHWLTWGPLAIALALLVAGYIATRISKPLKAMARSAALVGKGQQPTPLPEEGAEELRELAHAFNTMAADLERHEKERSEVLAGISHDLRTPLARLRLELEMSVPDEQARAYMASDIEQVTAIIDKFLDYARADQVTLDTVNLHTVLDEAVQAASKYGPLQVQTPEHEPPLLVKTDAVELRRVLVNVLENAIRYGRSANGVAEVDITLLHHNGSVTLQLQDHGPGVAEADLQRLVEPFFRGDQARTAATGSGLGLAIAHKTIARMGGQFELSAGQPSGLRVQIQLQKA